jgi:hypothetical protein
VQHGADEGGRLIDLLERLAQDDIVEGVRRVIEDLLVDIALQDRQPLFDAAGDLLFVVFDAGPGHPFLRDQVLEQIALPAAQVQHPRPGFDPGGDDLQIIADGIRR